MKMKKILMAVVFMFAFLATNAFADGKIGYVDLSKLFDEYHKTKEYDKVLEAKHSDYEKERNAKVEKVKESQGKLDLLADDKKAALKADIEKMKNDLLETDRQKQADLTKERNEKIRDILLEIEKIVSGFAEKENYSLILNDRVLIYGNPTMNVTEPILTILNGEPTTKK